MNDWLRFPARHWLASIFLIVLVSFAVLAIHNLRTPVQDPSLVAVRQAGYPVTLAELNAFYPAVPDEQNAALVYERAFATELFTNKVAEDLTRNINVRRGDPLPDEFRRDLVDVLSNHAATCQLLYSATNCPASRYPLDLRSGYEVTLPHLAKLVQTAIFLSLVGLSHASTGESNQAFASFNAAFHAVDSLRQEPILISYLVRVANFKLLAKRLEESLNLVGFSEPQLRRLQQRFAEARDQPWPARALAGERAFGLSFLIDHQIQRSLTRSNQFIRGLPSGLLGDAAFGAYRAVGLMAKDQQFYLKSMSKSVSLAEMTAEQRLRAGPPPNLVTTNRLLIFSRLFLPALQQTLGRADEHSARMRVLETALGVERFRLAHAGTLPEQLTDLVPEHLGAVPLDPYDAQPLRYKKLPHGYVVYSIGPDGHDDGGAEPPAAPIGPTRSQATPTDITFVVERN